MDFYVLADSDSQSDSVTLLKKNSLSAEELTTYGESHINTYAYIPPYAEGEQGALFPEPYQNHITYYTSETCGSVDGNTITNGCHNDYTSSDVKYIVDAWANDTIGSPALKEARLIKIDELRSFIVEENVETPSSVNVEYSWAYVWLNGDYWTMNNYNDIPNFSSDGFEENISVVYNQHVAHSVNTVVSYRCYYWTGKTVRPVVTLYKSALSS